MDDLLELRQGIDEIDRQIVELFEKRMEISSRVAGYKIQTGKKILDKGREEEKIRALKQMTDDDFNRHGIEELFKQIMSMSRKLQYRLLAEKGVTGRLAFTQVENMGFDHARVVFQGTDGAYSQRAMETFFGEGVGSFHVDTWRDAMVAIQEGMADFAVLPIENSTAGIVSEVYDLLVEFDNYIVGEQIIRIENALMGLKGAELADIRTVYSHPQALMQSSRFLAEHRDWQIMSIRNTAVAAKKVVDEQDKTQAAIAGKHAAKYYGLHILKDSLNDDKSNSTRFIVVTNQKIYRKEAKKVSVCFELPHESGSLFNILSHFIYNNLNMTKIESRPLEGRNWEYRFFVDFEGNLSGSSEKNALRGIAEEAINMRILGNY